jgi:hypothetical protein
LGGAFVMFVIGALASSSWECDGFCIEGWWTYMPLIVGVFCALATAWIVWERLTRSPAEE